MSIRIAVLGAGQRAEDLCSHLLSMPHRGQVVAVTDPDPRRRELFGYIHGVPEERRYRDWREFFTAGAGYDTVTGPGQGAPGSTAMEEGAPGSQARDVDAVLVSTMDRDHLEPAIAALEAGYHLLLEKPIVPTVDDLDRLESAWEAAREFNDTIAGVVHPLRYGESFRALKELVSSGRIGAVVTIDWLEQIGWWHFAHSYVRGNWRREDEASFILLAKSCHDIDYLLHLVDRPVDRVSSFGGLHFFTPDHAPEGSTERCLDCPLEPDCPYSALRWYLNTDRSRWPARAAAADHDYDSHRQALGTGPYGRCVWRCDNDASDHQTVSLEFSGGITATFTLTAFTARMARRGRIHGTTGEIDFDQDSLTIRDFADGRETRVSFAGVGEGHADADRYIIDRFLRAVEIGDQSVVSTGIPESAISHRVTFAAERARREGRVARRSEWEERVPRRSKGKSGPSRYNAGGRQSSGGWQSSSGRGPGERSRA
ncbi:MAG: Gfo/Idh/MocA family protein [Alkalispirochaeta sp.]